MRLGRAIEEIREEGLGAGDFKIDECVNLVLCDGSTMSLRYAFVVLHPEQSIAGVFSEHCGYYCFGTADLRITELRGGEVVGRHEP